MPDPRPNILLITIDQQRGDCLSLDSHGPSCLQTPNLDWVARTGTHFAADTPNVLAVFLLAVSS